MARASISSAPARQEVHLPITTTGDSAAELLAAASALSKQRIKQAMLKGAVWLTRGKQTRRLRRATKALTAGDTLHLYYDETILAAAPPTPTCLADEKSYSVWCKPAGMLAQGSEWGDHCAISRWVEQHLQRPVFVVHRLDREAGGLMLLAHDPKSAAALTRLFHARLIRKRYRVWVAGRFPAEPSHRVMRDAIDGRPAQTTAALLHYDAGRDQSLLEVEIDSGRKHQIRRHLAAAGFPVLGDYRYGGRSGTPLQLCAYRLEFTCPLSGKAQDFMLPPELAAGFSSPT
jgi:tRNA pseudouridine32 synthase/23S rRNA pseudouridine746 synthase